MFIIIKYIIQKNDVFIKKKEIPSFQNTTQVSIDNFESMFAENVPDNTDMSAYDLFGYNSPTVVFNPMLI